MIAARGGGDSPLSSSSTHCRGEGAECTPRNAAGAEIHRLISDQKAVFERLLARGSANAVDKSAVCARFVESLQACQAAVDEALGPQRIANVDGVDGGEERGRLASPCDGTCQAPVSPGCARPSEGSWPEIFGGSRRCGVVAIRRWRDHVIARQDRQSVLHYCETHYYLNLMRRALCSFLSSASSPSKHNASCQTSPHDARSAQGTGAAQACGECTTTSPATECSCIWAASATRRSIQFAGSVGAHQEDATSKHMKGRTTSGGHASSTVDGEGAAAPQGSPGQRRRTRHSRLPPVPPFRGRAVSKDDVVPSASRGEGNRLHSKSPAGPTRRAQKSAQEKSAQVAVGEAVGSIKLVEESVPGKAGLRQETESGARREERRAEREKLLHKVEAMETKLLREILSLDARQAQRRSRNPTVGVAGCSGATCSAVTATGNGRDVGGGREGDGEDAGEDAGEGGDSRGGSPRVDAARNGCGDEDGAAGGDDQGGGGEDRSGDWLEGGGMVVQARYEGHESKGAPLQLPEGLAATSRHAAQAAGGGCAAQEAGGSPNACQLRVPCPPTPPLRSPGKHPCSGFAQAPSQRLGAASPGAAWLTGGSKSGSAGLLGNVTNRAGAVHGGGPCGDVEIAAPRVPSRHVHGPRSGANKENCSPSKAAGTSRGKPARVPCASELGGPLPSKAPTGYRQLHLLHHHHRHQHQHWQRQPQQLHLQHQQREGEAETDAGQSFKLRAGEAPPEAGSAAACAGAYEGAGGSRDSSVDGWVEQGSQDVSLDSFAADEGRHEHPACLPVEIAPGAVGLAADAGGSGGAASSAEGLADDEEPLPRQRSPMPTADLWHSPQGCSLAGDVSRRAPTGSGARNARVDEGADGRAPALDCGEEHVGVQPAAGAPAREGTYAALARQRSVQTSGPRRACEAHGKPPRAPPAPENALSYTTDRISSCSLISGSDAPKGGWVQGGGGEMSCSSMPAASHDPDTMHCGSRPGPLSADGSVCAGIVRPCPRKAAAPPRSRASQQQEGRRGEQYFRCGPSGMVDGSMIDTDLLPSCACPQLHVPTLPDLGARDSLNRASQAAHLDTAREPRERRSTVIAIDCRPCYRGARGSLEQVREQPRGSNEPCRFPRPTDWTNGAKEESKSAELQRGVRVSWGDGWQHELEEPERASTADSAWPPRKLVSTRARDARDEEDAPLTDCDEIHEHRCASRPKAAFPPHRYANASLDDSLDGWCVEEPPQAEKAHGSGVEGAEKMPDHHFFKYLRENGATDPGEEQEGAGREQETCGEGGPGGARLSWRQLQETYLHAVGGGGCQATTHGGVKVGGGQQTQLPWIKAYRIAIQRGQHKQSCGAAGERPAPPDDVTFDDVMRYWQSKGW